MWPFSAAVFCWGTTFLPCTWLLEYAFLVHFHCQPQWYAFVLHNGVQLAKSSPTKAYSASQLLFLIVIFCHRLTEVDVAVNFFDLPSIDVDVHFVNYRIAHDFSLSQVHIKAYWFAGFMEVLFHHLQLWDWFSDQNYVICKDEVGQVFTIDLDTSVFPVDLANDSVL